MVLTVLLRCPMQSMSDVCPWKIETSLMKKKQNYDIFHVRLIMNNLHIINSPTSLQSVIKSMAK